MKFLIVFVLGVSTFALGGIVPSPKDGAEVEDTNMEPTAILKKYGYPAENHTVQTDDGYILTIHRIPYGRKCSADKSKGPVLVQHGLFSSSVDWFIAGTEHGLAYILADNCYDVWLANSRGNTFSKAHAWLDIKSDEYWDFSWHNMGYNDTPAVIERILDVTGWKDLLYVGHSQGTTQFFVFNTLRPEYSEKVRAAFLLAPVAFMENSKNVVIDTIAKFQGILGWIADNIGLNEFSPHNDFISQVGGALCSQQHPTLEDICLNAIFVVCGFDSEQFNETMIPIYLGHVPAGASTKQLLHYGQLFNSGKFRQFDYGRDNKHIYGQPEPPDYDLTKVTIPTFLQYSKNDLMAAVEDVETLRELINPDALEESILIRLDNFNHLDYIVARDVVSLVYDTLLNRMNRFS